MFRVIQRKQELQSIRKKLDSRGVSGYFIGYPEKAKEYRFHYPNYSPRVARKLVMSKFLENVEVSGSVECQVVEIKVNVPLHVIVHSFMIDQNIVLVVGERVNDTNQHLIRKNPLKKLAPKDFTYMNQKEMLRKSQRERRSDIPDDYVVYLQELDFDLGIIEDPVSFSQAIERTKSNRWINDMKD